MLNLHAPPKKAILPCFDRHQHTYILKHHSNSASPPSLCSSHTEDCFKKRQQQQSPQPQMGCCAGHIAITLGIMNSPNCPLPGEGAPTTIHDATGVFWVTKLTMLSSF